MKQNQHELRKEEMIEELHVVGNAEMHQKSLTETILKLTPILTDVIEQGISEGVFATPYPKETIEILLVSASFILDRKSTRLNSSHVAISYAVFCLKKKNNQ